MSGRIPAAGGREGLPPHVPGAPPAARGDCNVQFGVEPCWAVNLGLRFSPWLA